MFNWNNITPEEEKLIEAAELAKSKILHEIPNEEIKAIYLTGSLPRREVNKHSDIDTLTILQTPTYLSAVDELNKNFGETHEPKIGFSVLTLKNLESNTANTEGSALPDRFLKRLNMALLLYGEPIKAENYSVRSDKEELEGLIENIRARMIPGYQNKQLGFKSFIKNALWAAEAEYRLKTQEAPDSWKTMSNIFADPDHIIHTALKYRINSTTDETERQKFVDELEKYLADLEEKYL